MNYGEYDVTICENCKHWHTFNWLDSSTMRTVYDSECLKEHNDIAETKCKDFEMK